MDEHVAESEPASAAEGLAFAERFLTVFEAAGGPSAAELEEFSSACYADGMLEAFDWIEWRDQGHVLLETPGAMERAGFDELRRVLTMLLRQERFADGTVAHAVEQGWIHRVLHRMREVCAPAGQQ